MTASMTDWRDDLDDAVTDDALVSEPTPVLLGTDRAPRRERRWQDPDALIDARLNGDEPWPAT